MKWTSDSFVSILAHFVDSEMIKHLHIESERRETLHNKALSHEVTNSILFFDSWRLKQWMENYHLQYDSANYIVQGKAHAMIYLTQQLLNNKKFNNSW